MEAKNVYCVIMAGGVGSRFWPLSREERPKQFLDILGVGKSFIRQTYERFAHIVPAENFVVVTNRAYLGIVLEELPELDASQVLTEPARRNTAPAIAYAAYHIRGINPGAVMVVTPSDHLVLDTPAFVEVISRGVKFVSDNDALMTIGIKPSRPETGYGYIQTRGELVIGETTKVKSFTEKPDLELAKVFIKSGEFLWNSGIFLWSVDSIIEALRRYLPDMSLSFAEGANLFGTSEEGAFITKMFPTLTAISIDYGVMEKASNVYVTSADFGWSDIGAWGSLYENAAKDSNGNTVIGDNLVVHDVKDSVIRTENGTVSVIDGLKDYIVVLQGGRLLICPRRNEQLIKSYIDEIDKP